jgi:MraZ protein
MAGLVGEFEVTLDSKGRFLFPSGLRKQLNPASKETFMLNKGFEDCLTLYPMNEWEKLSEKLGKLNLFKPENRMFQRLFHQGAKQVVLDSAGRVHIPITHITRVGLKKDVILIAYHDRIEIWDRQRYFEMIDSNMKDFAELADKVMGGIDHEKYE